MGIGPVFAVPKLLERHGLKIDDIDLWELNEAFASQVLYCRDRLGIPQERLNVDGGAISIGHPYGMSGARMTGHALIEGAGAAPNSPSSPCASAAAWAPPVCSRSITALLRSFPRRREPSNRIVIASEAKQSSSCRSFWIAPSLRSSQ